MPHTKPTQKAIAQIFVLFILPMIFLAINDTALHRSTYIFYIVSLVLCTILIQEKWTFRSLGFRVDNVNKAALPYFIFTFLGILLVFAAAGFYQKPIQDLTENTHFLYGFILLSFFQELLFRSYLIPTLDLLLKNTSFKVLVNAFLFAAIHLFFPQPIPVFVMTFLMGAGLTLLYIKYPNIILATASHALINALATYHCFASFHISCL